MIKKTFTKFMVISMMALCPLTFYGQSEQSEAPKRARDDFKNYFYVTGSGGLNFLYGDNNKTNLRGNFQVGPGYQFDPVMGVKMNMGYGALHGSADEWNVDFSDYFNIDVNFTASLANIVLGYKPERKFDVTAHVGIGQLHYRTKTVDNNGVLISEVGYNKNDGINDKGTGIGMRKIAIDMPLGLTLSYMINNHWGVSLDYTFYYTDYDILDGIESGTDNDYLANINLGAIYKLTPNTEMYDNTTYCNHWFLTAEGGASVYTGDNTIKLQDFMGDIKVGVGYHFHNYWSVFAKAGMGRFNGRKDDVFTIDHGDYGMFDINLGLDLVNLIFGYKEDRVFEVTPHVGLGQVHYRSKGVLNGQEFSYGYSGENSGDGIDNRRIVVSVPLGMEITYKMKEHWDIYWDFTANYCNNDLIDGAELGKDNDWLTSGNIGLRYKFNNSCKRAAKAMPVIEMPEPMSCEDMKSCIKDVMKEMQPKQPQLQTEVRVQEKNLSTNYTTINYPIGKSTKIDSQANRDALNRACKDLNNGYKIVSIKVEGFASPEGSAELNEKLAKERTHAATDFVKSFLGKKADISNCVVTEECNGADWEGLADAIENSSIKDGADIANNIRNASDRSKALKEAVAKHPEIKKLYDGLRRANVTIITEK